MVGCLTGIFVSACNNLGQNLSRQITGMVKKQFPCFGAHKLTLPSLDCSMLVHCSDFESGLVDMKTLGEGSVDYRYSK